jgi:type IV pilus assembly protein PilM
VDDLRRGDEHVGPDDELDVELDSEVIGRLSAYGSDPEKAHDDAPLEMPHDDTRSQTPHDDPPLEMPHDDTRSQTPHDDAPLESPRDDGPSWTSSDPAAYSADAAPSRAADPVPTWAGDPMEPPPLSFSQHASREDTPFDPSAQTASAPAFAGVDPAHAPDIVVGGEAGDVELQAVDEGYVREDVAQDFTNQLEDDAQPGPPTVGDDRAGEPATDLDTDDEPALATEAVDVEPDASADASDTTGHRAEKRRRFGRRSPNEEVAPEDGGGPVKEKQRKPKGKKSKRLVGLKIGASQIAAAQVVNNGAPEVIELHREPLEPGIVVFGEIRDPVALAHALKSFFAERKLPKRGIRLGISNSRVGVRVFEVDGVSDPRQLENAIRFRAEEVLPIPLDQAVLDYATLEESVLDDGTPRKRILLVVAYRDVVDRYLEACSLAGLEIVGIDHEAFALLRSLEAPVEREGERGALVAVALGHDRTTMAVSTGEHCEFARVLDWGGWSLNVAIARELDRAPSEVEQLKQQLSFVRATLVEGFSAEQVTKARGGMQRSLEAFARELVSSLQFYQAQPGALGIGEIVLAGGAAHTDGLPEALGEIVGVPIRLGDPFKRLKLGPKVERHGQPGSLAIAIGLGIED